MFERSPSVVFTLPAGFDAGEVLPAGLRRREDDAHWLLNTILRKQAYHQTDAYGYARLHTDILRRIMSKRMQPAVVQALVDTEWIDPPAPYCRGVKSKGYRLTENVLSQWSKRVPATDPRLIERVRREWERLREERAERWLPIHRDLARIQRDLTILPEAESILNALSGLNGEARLLQDVLVENIRRRIPKFSVSSTGRCFNWISGLKRELRKALRLTGEPISGVDLACAQPALLALLIRLGDPKNVPTYKRALPAVLNDEGRGRRGTDLLSLAAPDPASDLCRFEELVLSGVLYEELVRLCNSDGIRLNEPRNDVKLFLLRDVLAKRGTYPCAFERLFERAFPSVYRYVRWANKGDHGRLIRILQRLESWIVIETVSPRLVDRIPFVTLHDAIYSRVRDTQVVLDAFEETFAESGFRLMVKSE